MHVNWICEFFAHSLIFCGHYGISQGTSGSRGGGGGGGVGGLDRGGGVGGLDPPLENNVKGFNPKYKSIS